MLSIELTLLYVPVEQGISLAAVHPAAKASSARRQAWYWGPIKCMLWRTVAF